ncbi:hypothetical protein BT63DRAFT_192201 [Microthyrium microscopicum]|uniref:Uncharacterized protein n=1 Tax=Microthyrium microscopicum TaxID=703497 RepID=A0A6A6UL70_9PEZI|nr:hypothetical protein BT63DRAFT_192201 [Microthyrium microscopicum]
MNIQELLSNKAVEVGACRNCREEYQGCKIGDGSCHAGLLCTLCSGSHCSSRCQVPERAAKNCAC